jgi:ribosome biogenesis protein MAK21
MVRRGRKGSKDYTESPTNGTASAVGGDLSSYQSHNSLLIQLDEIAPTWFKSGHQTAGRDATVLTDPPGENQKNTQIIINKYRSLADTIYRREVQLFAKGAGGSSDEKWVESTMKKGTLKDRVAAMSVVVSTDPVHKFYALDGLLQMAGCSESGSLQTNSRVAQLAAVALEDLFLNTFLPSDRKLMTLDQRPLYLYEGEAVSSKKKKTKNTLSPRILLLWRFEEMVKDKYQNFLRQYFGHTLRDGVEQQKIQALRSAAILLKSVPEGEAILLQMIVNKLGDPGKKPASSAGHELHKILKQHPVMQVVIAREVQQLVHRPHLSSRALYCCIIFLNQLRLDRNEAKSEGPGKMSLPASLISTYFRLFELAVKKPTSKKDENSAEAGMQSRLLSALLTGVNRAHPYLPAKDQKLEEHVDSLYRVVHTAPPAACTQALLLLFHLAIGSEQGDDKKKDTKKPGQTKEEVARHERFYRALYSTLSQTSVLGTGKHLTMFFNLLYKAMKNDTDTTRVIAFGKRILCTTIHCNSAVTAASLFLLNEISKYHPTLLSCFQDVLEGPDAVRVLDPTKREPRGALVSKDDSKNSDEDAVKRAPGWEVSLTSHHFHPSVAKFSASLGAIQYAGDPLKDFVLAPFLDKFAYRNPKSVARVIGKFKRGQSIAERRSATVSVLQSQFSLPVNDPTFLEKDDVGEQDEFFHTFFAERARRDNLKGIVRHKDTAAAGDDDEEGETEALDSEALDSAEIKDEDENVEEFNYEWKTDPEEEAFVDSLAESIMEDAVDGPADLDDEDPDMEGWDDMHDDDDKGPVGGVSGDKEAEGGEEDSSGSEDEEEAALVGQGEDDDVDIDDDDDVDIDDEDAFMEASEDSSGSDDEEEPALFGQEEDDDIDDGDDEDAFMEADDDSDSGGDDGAAGFDEDEDSVDEGALHDDEENSASGGSEDDLALLGDSSSDEDDDESPKSVKRKGTSSFADAGEYEEMIKQSYLKIKRSEAQLSGEEETEPTTKDKKKAKRRKK